MRVCCRNCGGAHPFWECTRPVIEPTKVVKPDAPKLEAAKAALAKAEESKARNKSRHRPGYMAEYRKRKKAAT